MTNPDSRRAALQLLTSMVDEKELKRYKPKYKEIDHLFMLPSTRAPELGKIDHDQIASWLYVRLIYQCQEWAAERAVNDLIPDRTFELDGARFYVEVDMGNMDFDKEDKSGNSIKGKMDRYIRYTEKPDKTIFVLHSGYKPKYSQDTVGQWVLAYADDRKRGSQFVVVKFDKLIDDTWGQILYSPVRGRVSLKELAAEARE